MPTMIQSVLYELIATDKRKNSVPFWKDGHQLITEEQVSSTTSFSKMAINSRRF